MADRGLTGETLGLRKSFINALYTMQVISPTEQPRIQRHQQRGQRRKPAQSKESLGLTYPRIHRNQRTEKATAASETNPFLSVPHTKYECKCVVSKKIRNCKVSETDLVPSLPKCRKMDHKAEKEVNENGPTVTGPNTGKDPTKGRKIDHCAGRVVNRDGSSVTRPNVVKEPTKLTKMNHCAGKVVNRDGPAKTRPRAAKDSNDSEETGHRSVSWHEREEEEGKWQTVINKEEAFFSSDGVQMSDTPFVYRRMFVDTTPEQKYSFHKAPTLCPSPAKWSTQTSKSPPSADLPVSSSHPESPAKRSTQSDSMCAAYNLVDERDHVKNAPIRGVCLTPELSASIGSHQSSSDVMICGKCRSRAPADRVRESGKFSACPVSCCSARSSVGSSARCPETLPATDMHRGAFSKTSNSLSVLNLQNFLRLDSGTFPGGSSNRHKRSRQVNRRPARNGILIESSQVDEGKNSVCFEVRNAGVFVEEVKATPSLFADESVVSKTETAYRGSESLSEPLSYLMNKSSFLRADETATTSLKESEEFSQKDKLLRTLPTRSKCEETSSTDTIRESETQHKTETSKVVETSNQTVSTDLKTKAYYKSFSHSLQMEKSSKIDQITQQGAGPTDTTEMTRGAWSESNRVALVEKDINMTRTRVSTKTELHKLNQTPPLVTKAFCRALSRPLQEKKQPVVQQDHTCKTTSSETKTRSTHVCDAPIKNSSDTLLGASGINGPPSSTISVTANEKKYENKAKLHQQSPCLHVSYIETLTPAALRKTGPSTKRKLQQNIPDKSLETIHPTESARAQLSVRLSYETPVAHWTGIYQGKPELTTNANDSLLSTTTLSLSSSKNPTFPAEASFSAEASFPARASFSATPTVKVTRKERRTPVTPSASAAEFPSTPEARKPSKGTSNLILTSAGYKLAPADSPSEKPDLSSAKTARRISTHSAKKDKSLAANLLRKIGPCDDCLRSPAGKVRKMTTPFTKIRSSAVRNMGISDEIMRLPAREVRGVATPSLKNGHSLSEEVRTNRTPQSVVARRTPHTATPSHSPRREFSTPESFPKNPWGSRNPRGLPPQVSESRTADPPKRETVEKGSEGHHHPFAFPSLPSAGNSKSSPPSSSSSPEATPTTGRSSGVATLPGDVQSEQACSSLTPHSPSEPAGAVAMGTTNNERVVAEVLLSLRSAVSFTSQSPEVRVQESTSLSSCCSTQSPSSASVSTVLSSTSVSTASSSLSSTLSFSWTPEVLPLLSTSATSSSLSAPTLNTSQSGQKPVIALLKTSSQSLLCSSPFTPPLPLSLPNHYHHRRS